MIPRSERVFAKLIIPKNSNMSRPYASMLAMHLIASR